MNEWIEKDLKYVWHPYTQMKDCQDLPPILIEKAEGIKLWDDKGRMYYDTISSWWCNIHGHNHPKIKAAIKKQMDLLEHVLFAGFTHKQAILLAEKLVAITPGKLGKVFFSDNGATSIETALKMSFQYWHNIGQKSKTKFVSLDRGYHGDTLGAMSVGGAEQFHGVFSELFFKSFKALSPYCYRCPVGKERSCCNIDCVNHLGKILKANSEKIAAVILEPLVMAAGGMIIYPKEYLQKAAELAEKYNVHLIVDEVATGFGRTAKMFACEHAGVEPDFMCLSKGITAGFLPLGATLTTDKVYNAFYDDYEKGKTFFHGHTYTANPISCSAAVASLEVFDDEQTLKRTEEMIPVFRDGLDRFKDLPIVGDVRSLGMIGAIELVKNKESKETFAPEVRIGLEIYKKGLEKGLLLRPLGDVIYLIPPLSIKEAELVDILGRCFDVIKERCMFFISTNPPA